MSLQSLVDNLTIREGNALLSQICLDFTVYFEQPSLDEKIKAGLLDLYAQVLARFGAQWSWYETDTSDGPKRIQASTLEIFSRCFVPQAKSREQYVLLLRDGEKDDDIGTTSFEIGAYGRGNIPGFVRLSLPTSFIDTYQSTAYSELCDSLLKTLPFLSAHAGFSLRWDEYGRRHHRAGLQRAEFIAEWYRGIDLPDDSLTILETDLTKWIRPVGWLTYLGKALIAEAGGLEHVESRFQPPVVTRSLEYGLAVQAGQTPQPGNSPNPEDLAAYETVTRALESVSMRTHPPIVREMSSWLARFRTPTTRTTGL